MDNLEIEGTFKNPSVSFDAHAGLLELEGKSIPERTGEFYEPLLDWIEEYLAENHEMTNVDLNLEYCNSSSTRYVLDILQKFEAFAQKGNSVKVIWKYEEDDEDMHNLGQSYQEALELNIALVPIN
ncbi:MAG TPA: DUF1987 domain-containing protein [Rhodospirillales bacterium]|nr:DUF1987 domain-containing protein [Rhodospirillales bacterium]